MNTTEYVAKAMYEAPCPDDRVPDEFVTYWPPRHPMDRAYWLSRAEVAIDAYEKAVGHGLGS